MQEFSQCYTVICEIPRGMQIKDAFQVYVFDDDREIGLGATAEQMGLRVKMPGDADLATVKASVASDTLTITVEKHVFP
ncbi:hypothetical protein HKX48_003983 [Thoreauomyces humboldtii]|nr:hypothetical protein HKX48_003983 [Thoreauomyces humboldtii]